MSLTVQQMVLDAKKLVKKLKESDNAADSLILKSQNVYKLLDTGKFSEENSQNNEGMKQNSNILSNGNIHHESIHLRQLQQENDELRATLDDYNFAVEMIMSKYREQVSHILSCSKLNLPELHRKYHVETLEQMPEKIKELSERIQNMGSLMNVASKLGEDYDIKTAELITRLTVENKGLRELLKLSNNYNPHLPNSKSDIEATAEPCVNGSDLALLQKDLV